MPNARPAKRTRTGTRVVTKRGTVVQPTTPLLQLSKTLTAAQREAFLAASGNAPTVNRHVAINVARTGIASPERSYDTKTG